MQKAYKKTVIIPNYIDIIDHNYHKDKIDKAYRTMK